MANSEKVPFYRSGLRFSCQPNCAACCKISGRVEITADDAVRMAQVLGCTEAEFLPQYTRREKGQLLLLEREDGACIMLNADASCQVHAVRPAQCRSYPFWSEILLNDLTWMLEKNMCPGIDTGRWYSAEEIEAIRDQQNDVEGYDDDA